MEYKVVYAETVSNLEQEINKMLKAGWHVQGGLTLQMGIFYQALSRS